MASPSQYGTSAEQATPCASARPREYGKAFNKLARRDDFIETEEREELFTALMAIPGDAGLLSDVDAKQAGEWLAQGLDEVRDW